MVAEYFRSGDSAILEEDFLKTGVKKGSIDLIITSPPYNLDIHYGAYSDGLPYDKYLEFTEKYLSKSFELAKEDGRFCLNVPLDKNKNGQQPVYSDILQLAKKVGWKYHSTVIWNEGNISRRTAWGSWLSAKAPYVIAPVETIILLYKEKWNRERTGVSDIQRNEFMDWTNGLWTSQGESKKKIGHPAPFPLELPKRCIKLFSFVGDTVLDPFLGSGSTLVASHLLKRKAIGVEIDKKYCEMAKQRLIKEANAVDKKALVETELVK